MFSLLAFTVPLALQFLLVSSSPIQVSGCEVPNFQSLMHLPEGFPAPYGELSYVTVGLGTQNYTCSDDGTYKSIGAVAELIDISCLPPAEFEIVTDVVIKYWKEAPAEETIEDLIYSINMIDSPVFLGEHYFVSDSMTGAGIPKFDFTTSGVNAGNVDAFVLTKKAFGAPAPTGMQDVDWLSLTNIGAGKLADEVYRTDTREGQPPASCTPGSEPITVKYAAKYWFIGGSIKAGYSYY
ncbi:hypothetical protein AGABI2DRAFT_144757 [Agaricus bisporus var. bisporus H97]|uniref:hypothetical protein n=1 Tax=Agaricus bisporus var. bisporus (strain H97 / ATCC MYA-4626 / FGSC 10389) TaxID=936046 RepID=UPI00029F70EE|nr:hypothetical protein AGABI2DRAFT_144757 [Agaricus bisporus var. bisporus H97]EKV45308.1 hypothetical protein AGABI2DRAFT_144757 [Agaricus bisporus var. bisporus H97]